jgi:hypothetical protein
MEINAKINISVGQFYLGRTNHDILFLTLNSGPNEGEGVEVDEQKLSDCLLKFYEENF